MARMLIVRSKFRKTATIQRAAEDDRGSRRRVGEVVTGKDIRRDTQDLCFLGKFRFRSIEG